MEELLSLRWKGGTLVRVAAGEGREGGGVGDAGAPAEETGRVRITLGGARLEKGEEFGLVRASTDKIRILENEE